MNPQLTNLGTFTGEPLVCPDCTARYHGMTSVKCALGHKPVLLDRNPICECGHRMTDHYDCSIYCMACLDEKDAFCEDFRETDAWVQATRRFL